jgi:hypothetical protein
MALPLPGFMVHLGAEKLSLAPLTTVEWLLVLDPETYGARFGLAWLVTHQMAIFAATLMNAEPAEYRPT